MNKRILKKCAAVSVGLALCILCIGQEPFGDWGTLGSKLAMMAVGMAQPADSAVLLANQMENAMAQVTPLTPLSTTAAFTTVRTTTARTTVAVPASATVSAPKKAANAGVISVQNMRGSDTIPGVAIRNSSGKTFDFQTELTRKALPTLQTNVKEPQVLIMHTHTTEGFLTYTADYYNPADVARSKDHSRNICAAGAAIAKSLEAAGVAVIHDTTIHDNPQYTGAYTRSEQTVKNILQQYPSIKVVLDVHRDAIMPNDTTHVKPTATVNGKSAAQLMLITGVSSTDTMPHKDWQYNLSFGLQLQKALQADYPDLMRPLSLVSSRYNQHLSHGSILVEVGSDVNTVEEAVYSGELLGKTIAKLLTK